MPNCDVSRHKLLKQPRKTAPPFFPNFQRMIRHFSILRVNPAENPVKKLTELTFFLHMCATDKKKVNQNNKPICTFMKIND